MKIGVVSDTHNRYKHIAIICQLFIQAKVEVIIHTGDIASPKALQCFADNLPKQMPVYGAWGNNDLPIIDMQAKATELGFMFHPGWQTLTIDERNIYLGHDPEELVLAEVNKLTDTLILHGHTHRYRLETLQSNLIFNPGECAGQMKNKNAVGVVCSKTLQTERLFF